jgi:hypothetical protein
MIAAYKDSKERKVSLNTKLLVGARRFLRGEMDHMIALDGAMTGTTKVFHSWVKSIWLPQLHQQTSDVMQQSLRRGRYRKASVVSSSLYDFMHMNKTVTEKTNIAFFDYMGTILGNKTLNIFPMDDIALFLGTTRRDRLVLGLTFCRRRQLDGDMFTDYIVPLIHRSRFHIVKEDIHPYKSTMIMYILYLEVDTFTIALE